MSHQVTDQPLDPAQVEALAKDPLAGALVMFFGNVRALTHGRGVVRLEYQAYTPMVLQELQKLEEEAHSRWELQKLVVHHRTGTLEVGQTAMLVAVSAPHRAAALEALGWLIDQIKTRLPIWKKEVFQDGEEWIEAQAPARILPPV